MAATVANSQPIVIFSVQISIPYALIRSDRIQPHSAMLSINSVSGSAVRGVLALISWTTMIQSKLIFAR